MKAPTKQQVLDLLGILAVTTGTAAGFAIGGLFGSEVMAALGIELGGKIIGRRSLKLRERWLSSDDGVLNHDIQQALARAFVKTLANLEKKYFNLPQAGALPKEEKRYIRGLFRQLKEQAQPGFLASLERATQEQVLKDYLYEGRETAEEKLWRQIDGANLLPAENEDFKKFLRENLFFELQFWFGEELKKDNKESNRAWRAFQRLLLEGIQADVKAVHATQALIYQDLQKLAPLEGQLEQLRDVIDHRLPNEPFQQGLERAVDQIQERLEEMYPTLQRVDQTTQRTEEKVDAALDLLRHGPGIEDHAAFVNTAPPMPPNFVPRPEELDELRRTVIGDRDTGPVALTGLRGMGGIGKTALAIALCHDDGLQEIFPDGVVWVDVGREPGNLAGKMRRVGQALGDGPGYYDTPEAGTDRLRLLLKDKAVLLVLDDVWDARHVEPFIVDAPRCRVLFTIRNADIALGLDAREIPLDVLAPEQAISLLREWTGRGEPVFPEIAKRLGYLPLALKLAGARLRGGMSGAEWLKTFQRVSQIKLSRRSTDPQENLLVCFELSVRELPAEDRRLYYALGIFPEDIRTPQSVVARLWRQLSPELSRFDCDELVTELGQLALIERNADDKTVTLHDLLLKYTHEQLGDELAATHAALLSAYNPDGKPWPKIEHDGYLYYYVAYHLREAGRKEELYALLTGSPDWMEAKFIACTGDTAYVADLDLAIGDFADPLTAPEVLMSVKLHTARNVVDARVRGYTDTDLRTLVWLGREDEALAHTQLRHEARNKFDGLLTVYNILKQKGQPNPSLLSEAREVACNIEDAGQRSVELSSLAVALAQSGDDHRARELFDEAREVARSIERDGRRLFALGPLAEALIQAGRYDEAREIACSIKHTDPPVETLISLTGALVQARRYEEAREVASTIEDDLERSYALSSLVAALAQVGRYEEAREVASSIEDDWPQVYALSSLAGALAQAGDDRQANAVFYEAREVARALERDYGRSLALTRLAVALAQAGHYEEAQEVAHTIENDTQRLKALRDLAEALAQAGCYEEAREAAHSIEDDTQRLRALRDLAAALAQSGDDHRARELFDEARELVHEIKGSWEWSEVLRDLARALAQAGRYEEARDVARGIEFRNQQLAALTDLAGAFAQAGHYEEAQAVAHTIEDDFWWSEALRPLAEALAQAERYDEAREIASSIEFRNQQSEALRDLAEALAQAGCYEEAREVARTIKNGRERSAALRDLAAALAQSGDDHRARELFDEAREVGRSIEGDSGRSYELISLAGALVQARRYEEAREVASTIEDDLERKYALMRELAAAFAQAGLYEEAREVAHDIKDDSERWKVLISLVATLAQARRFNYALTLLGLYELNKFLQALAVCTVSFEQMAPGLSVDVLQEATGIAGWVRPDWREIHELLNS